MGDTPGTPARPQVPNRYTGYGVELENRQAGQETSYGSQIDFDRIQGEPANEQVAFEQCFSGADYHITAVIPYRHRLNATSSPEVRQALEAIEALETGIAGKTFTQAEFAEIAANRVVLRNALKIAEQGFANSVQNRFYKTFGEIQTLSLTSRRSTEPVRRLGEPSPAQYLGGPRTFAGSMVFTMLQEEVLLDLYRIADSDKYDSEPYFVTDRLPPFNILITGVNERGHVIEGAIFEVKLIASGITLSIDDLYTEEQYTYVARWVLPLTKRTRKNALMGAVGRNALPLGLGPISELEFDQLPSDAGLIL